MSFIQILILLLLGYLGVYDIISKICKCVENCVVAKAFGQYCEAFSGRNKTDFDMQIKALEGALEHGKSRTKARSEE